ncbi:hypothetical protein D3C71_1652870 [compost metagenome]
MAVNSEVTLARLTPEMKNTSSVTLRRVSRNTGLYRSPSPFQRTLTRKRLAPVKYWLKRRKLIMYAWRTGICLLKPGSSWVWVAL